MLRMPSGITFATDQSAIQPQFRPVLDDVAKVLKDYPSTYIDVYGHTDSTGPDVYNQSLSERRAQAVADYLSVEGVHLARVATRGFDENRTIASNPPKKGKRQHRPGEQKIRPLNRKGTRLNTRHTAKHRRHSSRRKKQ